MKKCFYLLLLVLMMGGSCAKREKMDIETPSSLPAMYITLPPEDFSAILLDKELKFEANVLFVSSENDTLYEGELDHIKTRGNQTFEPEKKSFTLKFPMKTRLLDLYKSRSFVLLANALDESYIRNAISFDLADLMGLPSPRYAFLKLYVNGEYKGLYQLANKVVVNKHWLNITDLGKLNKEMNFKPLGEYERFSCIENQTALRKGALLENDPYDITGGYLLEYGCEKIESVFVSDSGDVLGIRSPKYASPNEVSYIADFYNQMEAAVLSADGINPRTGRHYSEYIDMESFARYYLLQEIVLNHDGGTNSFYMYKDSDSIDSKLYAGPAWDFDKALASPYWENDVLVHNEIFIGAPLGRADENRQMSLLHLLMQHEDFQEVVKGLYLGEVAEICRDYLAKDVIGNLAQSLAAEAEKDESIYRRRQSADYAAAVAMIKRFLGDRVEFLSWYYSASENDMVTVTYPRSYNYGLWFHREIRIYYPTGEPVYPPVSLWPYFSVYNNTPVAELFYAGTDSIVKPGTVFRSPRKLELRSRKPTWKEVQMRRVKKKLKIKP